MRKWACVCVGNAMCVFRVGECLLMVYEKMGMCVCVCVGNAMCVFHVGECLLVVYEKMGMCVCVCW